MTNAYYNPGGNIAAYTTAKAADVQAELENIQAGFAKLPAPSAIADTGGQPNYTHIAFADSADGSQNFTTGAPEDRAYVGFFVNQTTATPSENAADYSWVRIQGAGATYVEERYIRSRYKPARPDYGDDPPAGSSSSVPSGTEALWVTKATRQANGTFTTTWSAYERVSGPRLPVTYASGDTYYIQEQVFYGGGTYILNVDSSTGNAPSGTDQNNAYWNVVAAPGAVGAPASPPSGFTDTIDLTTATGANLRTLADAAGYTGMSDATITFRVPSAVTITGAANGGIGIDSGTWPSGYTIALTLVVQSGGIVRGGGGRGGAGGIDNSVYAGSDGGDAIYLREDFTGGITIDSGGTVQAGGGGGGGGASKHKQRGGGGGGGGAPNGSGGDAGSAASTAGDPGTTAGGGAGGAHSTYGDTSDANDGGPGGTYGSVGTNGLATTGGGSLAGGTGGAAGYAVRKNGNTATVTNNGTMTGTSG